MKLLRLFLDRSRGAMLVAVCTATLSGALATALIALINAMLTSGRPASRSVAATFISLCIGRLISGAFSQYLLIRLSQNAVRDLRVKLCQQILAAPIAHLEKIGHTGLTSAFSDDMFNIANVVVNLPYALVNLIIVVGCVLYFGWLSWHMLLCLGVCIVLGAASYLIPITWANRYLRLGRMAQDRLFAHFRALVHGIKELRMHRIRREAFVSDMLVPAADDVRRYNVWGITVYSLAANWNRLLFFIYVGLLIFVFPSIWPIKATTLAGYILVLLYMMAPLEAIMNVLPLVAQADIALKQIQKLGLSLDNARIEPALDIVPEALQSWDRLELRRVSYAYETKGDSHAFTLGPLDLILRRGEIIFITGGNGSGKTTLVKLLTGLYEPHRGDICVDGEPIDHLTRDRYRQLFSVVFSDFFLFDSLLGLKSANIDNDASAYLSKLQLQRSVKLTNRVFSTLALSQGQRKRLALMVAMLERRPIYVLDEWAADQDPHFKNVFYTEIMPELKEQGATIIVISHDDRYYHVADRLLRLEDGKLKTVSQRNTPQTVEAGTGPTLEARPL